MSNILRRSKSWRFPFNEWKWVLFDETTKQLLCRNFNTPFVPVWHVESLTKLLNLQIPNKCTVNWFDCRIASDFNWNRLLFNQSIFKFSIKRTTSQLIKKSYSDLYHHFYFEKLDLLPTDIRFQSWTKRPLQGWWTFQKLVHSELAI